MKKETVRAKKSRKKMTDAERILWYRIRNKQLGVKFRRQQPIGKYIVDFVCLARKFIIELDGGQHCDSRYDEKRDAWLKSRGYKILRIWNNELFDNTADIIDEIWKLLNENK